VHSPRRRCADDGQSTHATLENGALIAKLDTTDLELALSQSQAALEQSRASAKNARTSLTNADTAIEQARNQILIATTAYSKTIGGVRGADVVAAQAACTGHTALLIFQK
jgi:multidrug resistance efflux pump